ncbi:MAG: hypothetical protein M3O22_00520 [Pseudomonadota bacterium]|nr:hypothetical protein [Pseudomonadota bacterium]
MNRNMKTLLVILLLVVIAFFGYRFLTMPDNRTTGERIGDAVDALPEGPGKAIEELDDKTPGERLGDGVKDLGDKIKENTDR